MMAELMPDVPRVATAGAGLLEAKASASASPSATSTGAAIVCSRSGHPSTTTASVNCRRRSSWSAPGPRRVLPVSGDVDQMRGAEVRKAWLGRGPGGGWRCHGDDGPRALELTAEVFGADPAH